MCQLGRFDRGHAVAERLQASGQAVGNAVVDFDQRNFGQEGQLGKTAWQIETDHRSAAAECAAAGIAERAILAGQLGPGGDPIARPITGHAAANFDNPGTELVAEQLDRRFGFQPPLDAIVGQGGNAAGKLRSVTLGCTTSGSTMTWPGGHSGSGMSSNRRSLKP